MQRAVDLNKEKGSSTFLIAFPLIDHGFALHKSAFHDTMALHYNLSPPNLPTKCECGNGIFMEYELSCAKGGFLIVWQNA